MKGILGFIKGFIACLMIVYSVFMYVVWKVLRGEDICGFSCELKHKKPDYRFSPSYRNYSNYIRPKRYDDALGDSIEAVESVYFETEAEALNARDKLLINIEEYCNVDVYKYLEIVEKVEFAKWTMTKYGWDMNDIAEIKSTKVHETPNGFMLFLPDPHEIAM